MENLGKPRQNKENLWKQHQEHLRKTKNRVASLKVCVWRTRVLHCFLKTFEKTGESVVSCDGGARWASRHA